MSDLVLEPWPKCRGTDIGGAFVAEVVVADHPVDAIDAVGCEVLGGAQNLVGAGRSFLVGQDF